MCDMVCVHTVRRVSYGIFRYDIAATTQDVFAQPSRTNEKVHGSPHVLTADNPKQRSSHPDAHEVLLGLGKQTRPYYIARGDLPENYLSEGM